MTLLLIILGIAIVIAAIIVLYVTKVENDNKMRWEEHKWQTEAEDKELEDLDIIFEDIWGEMEDDKQ